MNDASFEALLRLCGIEPSYHDIWGKAHPVSRDTAQALAQAMGIDTARSVDATVAELERQRWSQRLDAAYVVAERDGAPVITLRLPADAAERPLTWRLVQENGTARDGTQRTTTLPHEAGPTFDGRRYAAYRYTLPETLPLGYHTFELKGDGVTARTTVIVTPSACYLSAAVKDALPIASILIGSGFASSGLPSFPAVFFGFLSRILTSSPRITAWL